jgi:hypothetical protein
MGLDDVFERAARHQLHDDDVIAQVPLSEVGIVVTEIS